MQKEKRKFILICITLVGLVIAMDFGLAFIAKNAETRLAETRTHLLK